MPPLLTQTLPTTRHLVEVNVNADSDMTTSVNSTSNSNTNASLSPKSTQKHKSRSTTDDADIAAGVLIQNDRDKGHGNGHASNSLLTAKSAVPSVSSPSKVSDIKQHFDYSSSTSTSTNSSTSYSNGYSSNSSFSSGYSSNSSNGNSHHYPNNTNYSHVHLNVPTQTTQLQKQHQQHDLNFDVEEEQQQKAFSLSKSGNVNHTHPSTHEYSTHHPATSKQSKEQILVLGVNISHLSRKNQFIFCALGVFSFSLLYGYLQELISVTLCSRQLGLFLAMMQFLGYTIWSKIFHIFVQAKQNRMMTHNHNYNTHHNNPAKKKVPFKLYLILSILRAIDAGMTNMAMAYVNYPAKTLMKSSRVVFTMLFGTIIRRKRYKLIDYIVVFLMVSGLIIFMHADAKSSAIFQPIGIIMLIISLTCDGAINNMSEAIMIQYNIGQDEFIYNLYSIAVCGIILAAAIRGDLFEGIISYMMTPGTIDEIQKNVPMELRSWGAMSKCMALVLFSSTGFFGSSCSALITKEFGALTMSLTSTARKAMTLFLSFVLFHNVCTWEHISGIVLFITALIAKSLRVSKGSGSDHGNDKLIMSSGKGHDDSSSLASNGIQMGNDETIPLKDETNVKRRFRFRTRRKREKPQVIANIV